MSLNPFVELYRDPVFVLGSLAYALALFAAALAFIAATIQLCARGWRHAVWLGNAWEWRHTTQQFGPEWEWYYPPTEVVNRLSIVVAFAAASALSLSTVVALLAAFVYVLG